MPKFSSEQIIVDGTNNLNLVERQLNRMGFQPEEVEIHVEDEATKMLVLGGWTFL